MSGHRPPGLQVIIGYKIFTATLLTLTAIAILLTLKNYTALQSWVDPLVLGDQEGITQWILEHMLQIQPRTLTFGGIAALFYAGLSGLEAAGLWYRKAWGRWLVLISIGISIPPELYELSRGLSAIKLAVFLLNLGIFFYVLFRFPKAPH